MTLSLRERFNLWRAMRKYNPAGSFTRLEGEPKTAPRVIKTLSPKRRRWWNWFWEVPRDLYPAEDRQKMKSLAGVPVQMRTYGESQRGKSYSYTKAGEVFLPASHPTAERIARIEAKIGYHSFPTTPCHECGSQVVEGAAYEQHWDGCSYHKDVKAEAMKAEARRDILTTKMNLRRIKELRSSGHITKAAALAEVWATDYSNDPEVVEIKNGCGEVVLRYEIPEAKVITPDSKPEKMKVRWDPERRIHCLEPVTSEFVLVY